MIYTSPLGEIPSIPTGNAVNLLLHSKFREGKQQGIAYTEGITGEQLRYHEVDMGAAKLAAYLQYEYGIEKGDVIVLSLYNSIYVPLVHLAALSLGAIISPANIMYESSDLAHQLKMVKPKLIIYAEASRKVIPEAMEQAKNGAKTLRFSTAERIIRELLVTEYTQLQPVYVNSADHPAYYCFSSGTSGLPKCVVTTHRNMISVTLQNGISLRSTFAHINASAAVIPMSHIYGLTSFVWTLAYLASPVVVYPRFDFELLLHGIIKFNIDNLNIVPPMVLLLAKSPLVEKYPEVRRIVKIIKSGAAPLSRSTIETLSKRFPGAEITNGYGLTEASPTTHIRGPDPKGVYELSSVGWLCPSTEMRIVDPETLEDVEPGYPGEVWIRGPQVMKGYLHNKQATDDMITPDNWMRTGDVGKVDEHEQLYIVDRIKELIKSNGHQVAPAELEGILLQHNHVLDCAVIGVPDAEGVTELPRGYVQISDGANITEIINWFNSKVARHKRLWGGIVRVDKIPKNNSGKILRRLIRHRENDVVVFATTTKL